MRHSSAFARWVCTLIVAVIPSFGNTIIFQRALPNASNGGTTYVNDTATAGRSNVSWISGAATPGFYFLVGDEFSFSDPGVVDSITVFEVANAAVGQVGTQPTEEFTSITLYYGSGGPSGTGLDMQSSAYSSDLVAYQPDDVDYEGSSGTFYPIYALTFSNLKWSVLANTVYGFALGAVPVGENTLSIHASNAVRSVASGVQQDGADDQYSLYYVNVSPGTGPFQWAGSCNSGAASQPGSCDGGFSSSTDLNVVISGILAPEPSSVTFVGAGVLGLLFAFRRSRR
jgi:hypothetical protein